MSQLQCLLQSINHYFLLSRNLSESKNNSNENPQELEYVTHQNKQNINSIHNNESREQGKRQNSFDHT